MEKVNDYFKSRMGIIGSLGQLLFYFQAFNIFWNKNAGEVTFIGFIISFISLSCWLTYGLLIKDRPLIIANITGVIGAFLVIIGIILYGL